MDTAHFSDPAFDAPGVDLLVPAISQAPFAALLFLPDDRLTLLWRNEVHGQISDSVGREISNRGMFEAFPPSDDTEGAAAMDAIFTSVAEIVETRKASDIGPYRYDLKQDDGTFIEHHWRISMSPVERDGEVVAILQVVQDVTAEVLDKRLADTLRRTAASTAAVSYFSYDPETDAFERTEGVDEMFGFAPGEAGALAGPFFERVHPEDLPAVQAEVQRVFAAPRGEVASFDYRVPHDDGTTRFIRIRAEVADDPSDRREKLVGTFVDLTDVELDRQQLKREVALREALVQEANHRIKNSLAIALAMLNIEKQTIREGGSEEASEALDALAARINAISGAHGLMQMQGHRTDVSMRSLLQQLVDKTRSATGLSEADVTLEMHGPDARLDSNTSTILALILNELATNAIKYGLSKSGRTDIKIVSETTDDTLSIGIINWVEEDDPIDVIPSTQLGSMLVTQFSEDFGATVDAKREGNIYTSRISLPRSTAD